MARTVAFGTARPEFVPVTASRLGLSPAWVYRHAGKLPFTVRVGRQVRFSARKLEAYIAARANGRPS